MSKWTTRNRASVITSDIEVTVYMKEQLEGAVKWLTENDFSYEWDVVQGDSITLTKYSLRVADLCWAHNLTAFAKILEISDYNSDVAEDTE